MTSGERDAVQRLLRAGRRLLDRGLPRDAADAFGRVLFKDPRRDAARRGLARARQLAAEEARLQEAYIAELRREPAGRSLLFVHRRHEPDASKTQSLARGRSRSSSDPALPPADVAFGTRRSVRASSRRTLVTFCAVFYSALLGITALHWNRFVEILVRTPSPVGSESRLMTSGRTKGELAVTEALRLVERGETASARSLLEMIPQADPAYPFSRHLRRRLMMLQEEP